MNPQSIPQCPMVEADGSPCMRPIHARGFCCNHYKQQWRRGDLPPLATTLDAQREYVKFAVTAPTAKQLRRTSRVTGKSIAQLVREAVSRYLGPDEIAR